MVIGLIVVLVIQGLDGNFINPKLLSNSISVNPILVIIALLIGASLGGNPKITNVGLIRTAGINRVLQEIQ